MTYLLTTAGQAADTLQHAPHVALCFSERWDAAVLLHRFRSGIVRRQRLLDAAETRQLLPCMLDVRPNPVEIKILKAGGRGGVAQGALPQPDNSYAFPEDTQLLIRYPEELPSDALLYQLRILVGQLHR